jgi:transposase-like protein
MNLNQLKSRIFKFQKKSKSPRYPVELKRAIVVATKDMKIKDIASELKISKSFISRIRQKYLKEELDFAQLEPANNRSIQQHSLRSPQEDDNIFSFLPLEPTKNSKINRLVKSTSVHTDKQRIKRPEFEPQNNNMIRLTTPGGITIEIFS